MSAAMSIDIPGLVVLLVLYAAILFAGIGAAWWYKSKVDVTPTEWSLVAGRQLGGLVGIFTMTATLVGGGFINGSAESVATQGLLWTLAPFGICFGLIIGGLLYAKRMRERCYLTMLDPMREKYGSFMVGLLYLAAICADLFWSASILAALGTTLSVIINLNVTIAIVVSACVGILYTLFGQMVSVAYTDILQLIFLTIGLVLCLPFIYTNSQVGSIFTTKTHWLGEIKTPRIASWVDMLITMTLGSIPWQTYFQRVLSVKSAGRAQMLSITAGFGAFIMAMPPILVGAAATTANWTSTSLGQSPMQANMSSMVLPLVLHHFTPRAISLIGLGAVAAAVMSSVDSAVLSSSSMFAHNIYNNIISTKASQNHLLWVQRFAVFFVGFIATVMAVFITSVYGMFILASDLVFVVMLPQLTSVLYFPHSNGYGALFGYILGLLLRLGAGESLISLPTFIKYPYYCEQEGQLFPFRTFAMLVSVLSILLVSSVVHYLFKSRTIPERFDILGCMSARIPLTNLPLELHVSEAKEYKQCSSGEPKKTERDFTQI